MKTRCPDRRLLVVEDDFTAREVISTLLAGQGYRVAAAANGVEALERLRDSDRPCLILLDLNMPVMDGPTFCARRSEEESYCSIPIILMSSADDLPQQAEQLGATRYLQKPVDSMELLETVRRCCP